MEIEEVKKEVVKILKDELPRGYAAFFFGSRVTGTASERADLDVGIEQDNGKVIPFEIMSKIKGGIESLPTLFTIDVVDFSTLSDDFKKVAKQTIETIICV
ncbi:MAG: hypothetical protein A3G59_02145 [Candidatus Taylorbacteria bacterium RIFCSPLOWO2_12_FULL_47_20]|uniref:Polymerase beta nucleotidyltransferase domain-containing protein n=2 Tax=Candidatus Tayloriibacteriota TaxID=1817919 RepID=A0A1G2PCD3_9BACT|nr:MAG: hypothetical protein A3H68_02975 [Candidatus Taylorbacteria bacterium RIFCSPLOWO2_02_FULL_46_40]OHA45251.1 MAG: hypothetical protein A3G59_02145 [Candidatus Taylorbacteria bacterium RIFCSPLOWO2_12_FULL_47_20]